MAKVLLSSLNMYITTNKTLRQLLLSLAFATTSELWYVCARRRSAAQHSPGPFLFTARTQPPPRYHCCDPPVRGSVSTGKV